MAVVMRLLVLLVGILLISGAAQLGGNLARAWERRARQRRRGIPGTVTSAGVRSDGGLPPDRLPQRADAALWVLLQDDERTLPLFLLVAAIGDGALRTGPDGWWHASPHARPVEAEQLPLWRDRWEDAELRETGAPLQVWFYHARGAAHALGTRADGELRRLGLRRGAGTLRAARAFPALVTALLVGVLWSTLDTCGLACLAWAAFTTLAWVGVAWAVGRGVPRNTWAGEETVRRVRELAVQPAALPSWQALCALGVLLFEATCVDVQPCAVDPMVRRAVSWVRYGEEEDDA